MLQQPERRERMQSQYSTTSFWVIIGVGAILLLVVIFTGNVLVIGGRLGQIHQAIELSFYGLVFMFGYLLLVRPLIPIFYTPVFPVSQFLDGEQPVDPKTCRTVARVILRRGGLSSGETKSLAMALRRSDDLTPLLRKIFQSKLKVVDDLTKEHAELAFLSTAISQNGSLDAVMLIHTNFKLLNEIVSTLCYRPSLPQLIKMYAQVFVASLVAERFEDVELSDSFSQIAASIGGGAAAWIPGTQVLVTSVLQGMGSAFLTLRTGTLAKNYILEGGEHFAPRKSRKSANREAAKMLLPVMATAVMKFPASVRGLLKPLSWIFKQPVPQA